MERKYTCSPESGLVTRTGKSHRTVIIICICALLILGFLLLMIFGADSYRSSVKVQTENAEVRGQLSTVAAFVRGGDIKGGIMITEGIYGPMLEIYEGGYVLRLYKADGSLMEEYGPAENGPDRNRAEIIGKTETFQLDRNGELLTVVTDEGQSVIRLRSGR